MENVTLNFEWLNRCSIGFYVTVLTLGLSKHFRIFDIPVQCYFIMMFAFLIKCIMTNVYRLSSAGSICSNDHQIKMNEPAYE